MPPSKKTFRDGNYYRHVFVGKRTVKEGECAAVWTPSGDRKLVEGPKRCRLWFSHVRFLDRYVADPAQFLIVQFRDGRKSHRRGPVALFFDPCVHEAVSVQEAYKLAANEALVVYAESAAKQAEIQTVGTKTDGASVTIAKQDGAQTVERRIIRGPSVFIPTASEWVHKFSWHGVPSTNSAATTSNKPGAKSGSGTGLPDAIAVPHGHEFFKLRCMPDHMYHTVKGVRTSDDAQLTIQLMVFFELRDIEAMLDASNDPMGDFINAASADTVGFGAANTYETFLQNSAALSELATFPILASRMEQTGFRLHKVVYRGYTTCDQLQEMHNSAIAKRTKLRLDAHAAKEEEERRAMELRCREDRSRNEQALAAAEALHELSLLERRNEAARAEKDAEHAQRMRHRREQAQVEAELRRATNDEDLRRADALKGLGVDLTQLMVAVESAKPDRHVRVESSVTPAVHLDMGAKRV